MLGRKSPLILLIVLVFLLSLGNQRKSEHINFIVIYADDLGYGDLGVFGNPEIKTPTLDKLAFEGQKWTNFYTADPACTPSRAALLTGRYPIRSGMTSSKSGVLFPDSTKGLPHSELTIAEKLKEAGYASAIIGKWHLGHQKNYLPLSHGFDYFWGIPYSNDMDQQPNADKKYRENMHNPFARIDFSQYNVPIIENEEIVERPANQYTITQRYTQKSIEFIRKNQNTPFFLYLAHSMPHIPLFVEKDTNLNEYSSLYGAVVSSIDQSVDSIVKALKELNLENNTILVFSSDNGPWLSYKIHGGSAGPLRAGKGTTFEGGQRVPTIFWGPSNIYPKVVSDIGSTLDILPTFAEIAGLSLPENPKIDGLSLKETLFEGLPSERKEFFYWAFGKLHAVRFEDWKLHILQREKINYHEIELPAPELFHLRSDIGERYDLAHRHPKIVDSLKEKLKAHIEDTADRLPDQLQARSKQ